MAVLSSTGWNTGILDAFQAVGQVAAAVQYQRSGAAKSATDAAQAEKEKQYELIAKGQTEKSKQETSKIASFVDITRIKTFFVSNWLIILIVIVGLLLITGRIKLPFLKRKGNPGRRSRGKRIRTRSVSVTSNPGRRFRKKKRSVRSESASSGFSRKIKGVVYTSKKAWADKMRSLRKKK